MAPLTRTFFSDDRAHTPIAVGEEPDAPPGSLWDPFNCSHAQVPLGLLKGRSCGPQRLAA